MFLTIVINWEKIIGFLGALVLVNSFLEKVVGINITGKKIYKGAPSFWKWIMRGAIFRKEIQDFMIDIKKQIDGMVLELNYNGGGSTKDQVRQIKNLLVALNGRVRFNEIRLDVSDILNDRMTGIMNKKGELVSINDVFLSRFGYPEEDVLRTGYESIVQDNDLNRLKVKWRRAVDTQSRFFEQINLYKKNGEVVPVCVRGFPDIDDTGILQDEYYVTFEILKS